MRKATFVICLFVSPAWTVMGAIMGSIGALSLTSFNVTTNDRGDDAATPVFSRATTWKRKRPGLGGSRSRFSSFTTRTPEGSMAKKLVVNSKVYAGFGSSGPWIQPHEFCGQIKKKWNQKSATNPFTIVPLTRPDSVC